MKKKTLSKKECKSIRSRMAALGWLDADLAAASQLSPTTIWRVLEGRVTANRATLAVMEQALTTAEKERADEASEASGQAEAS